MNSTNFVTINVIANKLCFLNKGYYYLCQIFYHILFPSYYKKLFPFKFRPHDSSFISSKNIYKYHLQYFIKRVLLNLNNIKFVISTSALAAELRYVNGLYRKISCNLFLQNYCTKRELFFCKFTF